MGPTLVYGARAENPPKNADFAMKQTNICRLSGDINPITQWRTDPDLYRQSVTAATDLVINPQVGCRYFYPGLRLPSELQNIDRHDLRTLLGIRGTCVRSVRSACMCVCRCA